MIELPDAFELMTLRGSPIVYTWERDGKPIYIGSTNNLLARLGGHHVIGVESPFLEGDRVAVVLHETLDDARVAEATLIWRHTPMFNGSTNRFSLVRKGLAMSDHRLMRGKG